MSDPQSAGTRSRGSEWVLVFRIFVLFPALLTAVAVGATSLWSGDSAGEPAPSSRVLAPAQVSEALPEPIFGPTLGEVFSAADAVEAPGGWVVLDRRSQSLVLLDEQANLIAVAAGEGAGPGELSRAASVAVVDSTIVVIDGAARALELFTLTGRFLQRVALPSPTSCSSASVRELIGESGTLALLSVCSRRDGSSAALVERISLTGTRDVLLDEVYQELGGGPLDPLRIPLLARVGGRLHFAVMSDVCVRVLETAPAEEPTVCHPDAHPVMLPDSLKSVFRDLEPRARALGTTVLIPERLPPFDALVNVGGRLGFHVVLHDRGHAYEVVHGDRLERIMLPNGSLVAPGSRSLLVAQDRAEGTAFAVLPLP